MDDSSFFMQWAMDTLHQLPSDSTAAAAYATDVAGDSGAFPSLQALRNASAAGGGGGFRDLTVQVDQVHRANSWSSSDSPGGGAATAAAGWSPHVTGGGGRGHRPMSWNFSAASAQPTTEDSGGGGGGGVVPAPLQAMETTATARAAVKKGGGGGSSSSAAAPGYVQDHIIAERRRREKINQRFIELSTVIPGLKKMDKATILGDAVKYVKELQEKVKTLEEEDGGGRPAAMVVRKSSCSGRQSAAGDGDGEGRVPEIEVRVWERSVLVRVQCGNSRGLLVRLLSEVEELRLGITHTSVMPFPASTVIITITAKVEEGFNSTVDEIMRRLNSALLDQYNNGSVEETDQEIRRE
ncbi:transcription factor NAI1 [Oryza sativa Japonica Group]|uniref:Os12g0632600 protein n=1 Tax=Oryza sativa subsp. japonica TaxID=39947 RepID=A0A0P0YCR0_ORYSJ|nr:transcription factor NAI1 isoform X2 [Oryza sativa Japonica Group]BAT18225.1 Os12g0632600 [Oryza sativa Japonica Group]